MSTDRELDPDTSTKELNDSEQILDEILLDYALRVSQIDHEADNWEENPADAHEMHTIAKKEARAAILQHYISKERISAVIKNQKKDNRQQHGIGYCKSCCLLEILEGMLGENLGLDDKS